MPFSVKQHVFQVGEKMYHGQNTTNAGTAKQLTTATNVNSVTIKALSTNTGSVYIGKSTVTSANGYELLAGDSVSIDYKYLGEVYFDVSVNGEGVSYIALDL